MVVPGDTIESICETRLGDARYADLLITINRSEVVYRLHNGSKGPFGIITADTSAEVETQATQAGADFVIRKPFTAAKFNEVLAKL